MSLEAQDFFFFLRAAFLGIGSMLCIIVESCRTFLVMYVAFNSCHCPVIRFFFDLVIYLFTVLLFFSFVFLFPLPENYGNQL